MAVRHKYSRNAVSSQGTVPQAFVIDTSGYASASARSWDSVKLLVTKVVIDPSFASAGVTNTSYAYFRIDTASTPGQLTA